MEFKNLTTLTEVDKQRVLQLQDFCVKADRVNPLSEFFIKQIETGGKQVKYILGLEGKTLAAFAVYEITAKDTVAIEFMVDPAVRNRGIGTRLAQDLLKINADKAYFWAHGNLPPSAKIARNLKLTLMRNLLKLEADPLVLNDNLPTTVKTFPGVVINKFVEADIPGILQVNNAAFAWHPEQKNWTEANFKQLQNYDFFDSQGFLVAKDNKGLILGFVVTKITSENKQKIGEIYLLGVAPKAQGKHLGKTLLLEALRYLIEKKCQVLELYVEAENTKAVNLYEHMGFSVVKTDVAYSPRGV